MIAAGFVWALVGQPVEAPEWVRVRIEDQLRRVMPNFETSFGGLTLVVEDAWHPRVQMRDIVLTDPGSVTSLTLSDMGGTLALLPLLRGQISPREIHLSGAVVNLRRSTDGSVDVSIGDGAGTVGESADLTQFIARIDEVLQQPQWKYLKSAEIEALTLRYDDARAGRGWTVDGGRARLTRNGDTLNVSADLALLSGRDYATTVETNYVSDIGSNAAEFGVSFEDMAADDIASQVPALAWLNVARAPISGALRTSIDEAGALGPLNATLQIGEGVVQPADTVRPIPFQSARSYFTYLPQEQTLRFDEFSVVSDWVTVRGEGKAHLKGMESGWPTELLGQVVLTQISANPQDFYPEPVSLEGAQADFRLLLDPFTLDLGQMVIRDQGQNLHLSGELVAAEDDWHLSLDGRMDAVSPERVLALWPESLGAKPRKWVADNIKKAGLKDIVLALRSQPGSKPQIALNFNFYDATIRFLKTLPPLTGAMGHASLMNDRFVAVAEAGGVQAKQGGMIDATGTAFIIHNTRNKGGPAQVRLNSNSTITAALWMLDQDPWNLLTKAKRPVAMAKGRAQVAGTIDIVMKPKLKPEEVDYDLAGTLYDVQSDQIVPNKVLSAASLDVTLRKRVLKIGGDGALGSVPFNGTWVMPIDKKHGGKSHVEANVVLDKRAFKEFNIGLPDGYYSGRSNGQLRVDIVPQSPPTFSLTSNLRGLGLALPPLGWAKSRDAKAKLTASGRLGTPPMVDKLSLTTSGLAATGGNVALKADGGLKALTFKSVKLDKWLDTAVELRGRGVGKPVAVIVTGGTVDTRGLTKATERASYGGGSSKSESGPILATLDRVRISDSISLTEFQGEFDPNGGISGRFSGKVNDGAAVIGEVVPIGERSAFTIRSSDGGGVLRSAGILDNARDGKMLLELHPARTAGIYNGRMQIFGTRVRDAPAMAELLNAISVVGLLEQMGGSGIHFAEVDAQFQLTPTQLLLAKSSAVGPSMGISMDGIYDFERGLMSFQGVLSPIYMVNIVGRVVAARKGEGLIGFNYQLSGRADNPRVQVNPLSILTPGFFREIFRRPPPKLNQ